jgi:hypothetical protein
MALSEELSARHSAFNPQGDGEHGSLVSFGFSGSGTQRENGLPTIPSGHEQIGTNEKEIGKKLKSNTNERIFFLL